MRLWDGGNRDLERNEGIERRTFMNAISLNSSETEWWIHSIQSGYGLGLQRSENGVVLAEDSNGVGFAHS